MPLNRLFLAIAAVAFSLGAGPISAAPNQSTAIQWVPTDLVFNCAAPDGAEFEVNFSATFSGPGAASLTVPGFYDGGDRFLIRFAPPAPGLWIYSTASSLPKLDNNQGEIKAVAAPALQRGPVSLNPGALSSTQRSWVSHTNT